MIIALLLGILQGLTEFIPVSSSGHLVLAAELFTLNESSLAFDVALHVGTLLAVTIYFRHDLVALFRGIWSREQSQQRLALLLGVGTIPAVIAGVLAQDFIATSFRSPAVVAVALVVFAIVMLIAEQQLEKNKAPKQTGKLSIKDVVIIGCLQACALVPGVSRSGATISGGLLLKLDRVSATRFSFLLALPVIFGASLKVLVFDGAGVAVRSELEIFIVGFIAALLSGLIAIRFLITFVAKYSLRTFAYYRFVLAAIICLMLAVK